MLQGFSQTAPQPENIMKSKPSSLVASAKILASTMLVAVGAIGHYADFYPHSVRTRVAMALLTLGLMLLAAAWTGGSVRGWVRDLYRWMAEIGVENTKPAPDRSPELVPGEKTSAT
jgi:hypothetical protein